MARKSRSSKPGKFPRPPKITGGIKPVKLGKMKPFRIAAPKGK